MCSLGILFSTQPHHTLHRGLGTQRSDPSTSGPMSSFKDPSLPTRTRAEETNRQSCFEEAQHGGRCLQCHLPRVGNTSSLCLSLRGTSLCRTLCQADTDTHPPRAKPNFRPHPPPPLFHLPWRAKRGKKQFYHRALLSFLTLTLIADSNH